MGGIQYTGIALAELSLTSDKVIILRYPHAYVQAPDGSTADGTDSSRSGGSWWGGNQPSSTPTPSPSSHFQPVPTPGSSTSTTGTSDADELGAALGRSGAEVLTSRHE